MTLTEPLQLGRHMPLAPTVLTLPEPGDDGFARRDERELRVKRRRLQLHFLPQQSAAERGMERGLFAYKLNIRDIIPISAVRIHLAPSAWATFEATGFMVVTLVPRMAVADLNAEELPSYHRTVDDDETVFVHDDASGARRLGMMSHTPQGILHGADEATRAVFQKRRTAGTRRTLTGVSVDTERPLIPTKVCERLTH